MSCSTSSAAMVDGRMRLSANARSSGTDGLRWWHTINMSRCSASVFTVCGRVGLVDDGSTLGCDGDGDDVGRVAAARALGVVRVDRPAARSRPASTRRSRPRSACRCGSPPARPISSATVRQASIAAGVVPQSSCSLNPPAPPSTCSHSPSCDTVLPLPSSTTLTGIASIASCMRARFHAPGRDRGGLGAVGRPGAAADDRGDARRERLVDDLRADQVHVAVDRAGGEDAAVARQDLGRRADDERRVDAVIVSGLPALPMPTMRPSRTPMSALTTPQWSRISAPVMTRSGVPCGAGAARLAHRLADDLAAAEHGLVAADAQVALDLDQQVGVGQADPVAGGRPVQPPVVGARDLNHRSCAPRDLAAQAGDDAVAADAAPASTVRSMPGSKRTDVPAAMSSR